MILGEIQDPVEAEPQTAAAALDQVADVLCEADADWKRGPSGMMWGGSPQDGIRHERSGTSLSLWNEDRITIFRTCQSKRRVNFRCRPVSGTFNIDGIVASATADVQFYDDAVAVRRRLEAERQRVCDELHVEFGGVTFKNPYMSRWDSGPRGKLIFELQQDAYAFQLVYQVPPSGDSTLQSMELEIKEQDLPLSWELAQEIYEKAASLISKLMGQPLVIGRIVPNG